MPHFSHSDSSRRITVAITGASGAIYGVRLLQTFQGLSDVETHLVVSNSGWLTLAHELNMNADDLAPMVHSVHQADNLGALLASGSFRSQAMVVAPCTMRTLAAIAHGLSDNLVTRAADVMLKERRPLVLMARETPLHLTHLRNMVSVTEMGAIVCPPVPAFYLHPKTINDVVDATVARVLDLLDLPHELSSRWTGLPADSETASGL